MGNNQDQEVHISKGSDAALQSSSRLTRLWFKVKKSRVSYVMIAPYMILFVFFTVIPVITAIFLSFTYFNIIESPQFIGWSNYMRLFLEDDVFIIALKNTFVFALITGPLSYMACFVFAWLVNELKPRVRAFATILFYGPSLAGGTMTMLWMYFFSSDEFGLINNWLLQLGIFTEPFKWLQESSTNFIIVIIVALWGSLSTSFLVFIAGLQGVDKELYESGSIDGIKNRWQELYHITFPAMKPQLILAAILNIAGVMGVGELCRQLTGMPSPLYSTHTLVLHMEDYGTTKYEMGYAASIAVVLFAITLLLRWGINKIIKPEN
ncbi:MAG: sugar ABC transporter permease [Oscillospiraceae bacterium]|nr:sugar ABC transporter permease [Oscillospiraceae bacterium]